MVEFFLAIFLMLVVAWLFGEALQSPVTSGTRSPGPLLQPADYVTGRVLVEPGSERRGSPCRRYGAWSWSRMRSR